MGIAYMLVSVCALLLSPVFMGTTCRSHSVYYCTPTSKYSSLIHIVYLTNVIQKPNKKLLYLFKWHYIKIKPVMDDSRLFPDKGRHLSLCHHVHTDPGSHPAFLSSGYYRLTPPRCKTAGPQMCPHHLHLGARLEMWTAIIRNSVHVVYWTKD